MGRRSPLTPEQWIEVERRHLLEGESVNSLAKEFKIDESAIRRKFNPNKSESKSKINPLKELALSKIEADKQVKSISEKIAELPFAKQQIVMDLSRSLMNISNHLTSAAEYGARTSHKLAGIANAQVEMIDDTKIQDNTKVLQNVAALTRMANESSVIAMGLLNANKDRVQKLSEPERERVKTLNDFYGEQK
jgi:hypothetical protein